MGELHWGSLILIALFLRPPWPLSVLMALALDKSPQFEDNVGLEYKGVYTYGQSAIPWLHVPGQKGKEVQA